MAPCYTTRPPIVLQQLQFLETRALERLPRSDEPYSASLALVLPASWVA